jgi:hypothetical protein
LTRNRHLLRCKAVSRSRRKACSECIRAKTRCDQKEPACSRCSLRSTQCIYPLAENGNVLPHSNLGGSSLDPGWSKQLPSLTTSTTADSFDTQYDNDASPMYIRNQADLWLQPEIFHSFAPNPVPLYASVYNQQQISQDPVQAHSSPFSQLSQSLMGIWKTRQDGLWLIEQILARYPSDIASGNLLPPFLHHTAAGSTDIISTAMQIADSYILGGSPALNLILSVINTQINDIAARVRNSLLVDLKSRLLT